MNSKEFSLIVEQIKKEKTGISYMDAILHYCEEHKIMWALNPDVKMPSEEELKKMPIENTPSEKKEADAEKEAAKKMFPFMINNSSG